MSRKNLIRGVDLFCGVGGLTKGLQKAGIEIEFGADIDPACRYPFEHNCKSRFIETKVEQLKSRDFEGAFDGADFTLMAGCAPCQPFSRYQQKAGRSDSRWGLLKHFGRLVRAVRPQLVTMENVPRLSEQSVFRTFVNSLLKEGYSVDWQIVDCSKYGVPQTRQRLVLLASVLGPIKLLPGNSRVKTVRETIGKMPAIKSGRTHPADKLHVASALTEINLKRIKASKPGGTWRDWDPSLVVECHRKRTGKSYPGVYGRMDWDQPAPTMTTQFFGYGNGRFGHPKQNRAITLREGALLQTFPKGYRFVAPGEPIEFKPLGRLIGNAVPVKLGEVIGRSMVKHCANHAA